MQSKKDKICGSTELEKELPKICESKSIKYEKSQDKVKEIK